VTTDGPAVPWVPGVGPTAMRERAEELGGTFRGGPLAAGGALATCRIPLVGDAVITVIIADDHPMVRQG
jgi:hypothetical protein